MVYQTILEAVGNTPLVQLQHLTSSEDASVYVKVEGLNVGGSIKTRTALRMIEDAEKKGLIQSDTVLVEPTSGNQGIGIALVAAVKGYKAIIIMPDSVSEERRKIIQQYGAEIVLVEDRGDIGECIKQCDALAKQYVKDNPNYYMPNQFANIQNRMVHYEVTAQEILKDMDRPIDAFCSGIGTGGTISGIGKALKEKNPEMLVVAIEPEHAAILSGKEIGTHVQMGIGDGLIPEILDTTIYDEIEIVTDEEAIQTSRLLAEKEGILCGISSGTNVSVALKLAKRLGKGHTVVTILPDTGERYFSTALF